MKMHFTLKFYCKNIPRSVVSIFQGSASLLQSNGELSGYSLIFDFLVQLFYFNIY